MGVAGDGWTDLPGVVHIFFDEDAICGADVENVAEVDPAQTLCSVQRNPTARKARQLGFVE